VQTLGVSNHNSQMSNIDGTIVRTEKFKLLREEVIRPLRNNFMSSPRLYVFAERVMI